MTTVLSSAQWRENPDEWSFPRRLPRHRGRSGPITAPQTVRAYASAITRAFTGIKILNELDEPAGRARLHENIRAAWGDWAPATFNARRAAVSSALTYFEAQQWITDAITVLTGLRRKRQPTVGTLATGDRHGI
ncbi:hypothetical protein [Nocardia sp. NPDC004711]